MSDDMFFDVSAFDFDSLVDVVEVPHKEATPKQTAKVQEFDEFDPAAFFTDDDEDQPALKDTSFDPNDDVSDLLTDDDTRPSANEFFDALGDDAVLTFDGAKLTKAEIKELYHEKELINQNKDFLKEASKNFDEGNQWIIAQLSLRQTAVDRNIEILQRRLNNPNISNTEYGETSKELRLAEAARQELNQIADQSMKLRYQQEQELIRHNIIQADQAMVSKYPNWPEMKAKVLLDAVNNRGVDPVRLEKIYDAGIAQLMLDAYMYQENKKRVQTKATEIATRTKAPRSAPASSSSKRGNPTAESEAQKARALKKMGGSRQDNINAFAFLKD